MVKLQMMYYITQNGLSYVIYGYEGKEKDLIIHYSRIDYDLISANIKKENIIYEDEPGYEN